MNKRYPFPRQYWVYLSVILLCIILLVANFYRTDSWTGDKPFSEFTQHDWQLLTIFLMEELIILGVLVLFVVVAGIVSKKRNRKIALQWENGKYSGIKPGDYDYVWFDFSNMERALILQQGNQFILYVQKHDDHTGNWENLSGVSVYNSLETVKIALLHECDFYCEENAELAYGDGIYKEK